MVNSTANQLPTDIQFEKQLGQLATFIRVMRQAGLPIEEALQGPIDDPDLRERLVRFWNASGYAPTTSQQRAREIMGKNFFGVEEAMRDFCLNPSRRQLAVLSEIPYTEAMLEECKDSHVLVAVFPLSILEIRGRFNSKLFYDQSWYNKESFAKDRGEAAWHLIRKDPVPNSTSKTWNEQRALLAENEETPQARVMIYTIIGHFLATDQRLFEDVYVRCSDVVSGGYRVYVGDFDSYGLDVDGYWDGYRRSDVGLASSRKFPA